MIIPKVVAAALVTVVAITVESQPVSQLNITELNIRANELALQLKSDAEFITQASVSKDGGQAKSIFLTAAANLIREATLLENAFEKKDSPAAVASAKSFLNAARRYGTIFGGLGINIQSLPDAFSELLSSKDTEVRDTLLSTKFWGTSDDVQDNRLFTGKSDYLVEIATLKHHIDMHSSGGAVNSLVEKYLFLPSGSVDEEYSDLNTLKASVLPTLNFHFEAVEDAMMTEPMFKFEEERSSDVNSELMSYLNMFLLDTLKASAAYYEAVGFVMTDDLPGMAYEVTRSSMLQENVIDHYEANFDSFLNASLSSSSGVTAVPKFYAVMASILLGILSLVSS